MRKFITIVLSFALLITSVNLSSMLVSAEEMTGGSEITLLQSPQSRTVHPWEGSSQPHSFSPAWK